MPPGVPLDASVGILDEVDELEQFPCSVGGLGPRHAEQPGLQDHQLAAGLADVEPGLLQGDADLPPHGVGIGGHVDPGHARAPGRDRHERRQHPDGRRLAGPVRPEEAEDLAALDMQVDAAHRLDRAPTAGVVLDELVGFYRERHGSTVSRSSDSNPGRRSARGASWAGRSR